MAPLASVKHMSRGKTKKKSDSSVVTLLGLNVENTDQFYKSIRCALKTALGYRFLAHTVKSEGTREIAYIREPHSPTVLGKDGPLPALLLYSDDRQSAWLVIEIESEGNKPSRLQHVSMKLWQGVTTEAAQLCFRAEWDVREPTSQHAQPHWNVHAPAHTPSDHRDETFRAFELRDSGNETSSFAEFVQSIVADGKATEEVEAETRSARYGFSVTQMHRFHFAMAVNWHSSTGTHSPKILTPDEVVCWINACACYIRQQFAFMMDVQ